MESGHPQSSRPEKKAGRGNLRTALVLLSIALVFFIGVIVNRLFL